jgi:ABC-type nitrate/sulfonate/bicarbonate transport system substrate-binding protein
MDKGADIVAVADMINSPYSLLATHEVSSYDDVRGKKVGVSVLGSADSAVVLGMLAKGGVSFRDVEIIQTGGNVNKVAALSRNVVQAVSLLQPFDLQALGSIAGTKRLAFSANTLRIDALSVDVNRTWAKKNPGAVVKFLRAHLKARDWLANPRNEDEAIDIFVKYNGGVTRAITQQMYDMYRRLNLFRTAVIPDMAGVNQFLKLATLAGEGTFKDARQYYNTVYLKQALADHKKKK